MNEVYWESRVVGGKAGRYPAEDQTHHFAAYFQIGSFFGNDDNTLRDALVRTNDLGTDKSKPELYFWRSNPGDYFLGLLAADLGHMWNSHPGYIGATVTSLLKASRQTGWSYTGRTDFVYPVDYWK